MTGITEGKPSLAETAKACVPCWLVLKVGLVIITFFPRIVLFVASLLI